MAVLAAAAYVAALAPAALTAAGDVGGDRGAGMSTGPQRTDTQQLAGRDGKHQRSSSRPSWLVVRPATVALKLDHFLNNRRS